MGKSTTKTMKKIENIKKQQADLLAKIKSDNHSSGITVNFKK